MNLVVSLVLGIMFGVGLVISQMVNPEKVLNFLDLTGHWDPSLILVMLSALLVYGLGFLIWVRKMKKPLLANAFDLPTNKIIDSKLILGATLFGIGWGLSGICPGPALANILGGNIKILAFTASMVIGMKVAPLINLKGQHSN